MVAWRSGCDSSACIEVLDDPEDQLFVHLRTSWYGVEIPARRAEWEAFKQAVKDGKFD